MAARQTADEPASGSNATVARPLVGPPTASVREVDVDGCLTLYRRASDQVLVLNETASEVWRLADGTLDEEQIVVSLAEAYGVPAAAIRPEVRETIERFVTEGLLGLVLR